MSSTARNLLFLETMLGQYLHEHYIDETDSAMYTKPVGFRMPYTRGITDLERNMKYVEVQLDKYLHKHETDTVPWGNDAEHRITPAVGNFESTTIDSNPGDDQWWSLITGADYVSSGIISTGSYEGNKHFNLISSGNDGGTLYLNGTAPGNAIALTGDNSHVRVYRAYRGTDSPTLVEAYMRWSAMWYDSGGAYISEQVFVLNAPPNDWSSGSMNVGSVPSTAAGVRLKIEFIYPFASTSVGNDYHLDYVRLTEDVPQTRDILYWTPQGFRFPYDWKRPDAINNNRRFLETELSQYLHEHEAVTT